MNSGTKGEEETVHFLSTLPDTYHIFTSVRVHEKMEADAVVVGQNGVFVVESKNYKGELVGTANDKKWTLNKIGRKGGEYSKSVPNRLFLSIRGGEHYFHLR